MSDLLTARKHFDRAMTIADKKGRSAALPGPRGRVCPYGHSCDVRRYGTLCGNAIIQRHCLPNCRISREVYRTVIFRFQSRKPLVSAATYVYVLSVTPGSPHLARSVRLLPPSSGSSEISVFIGYSWYGDHSGSLPLSDVNRAAGNSEFHRPCCAGHGGLPLRGEYYPQS